MPSSRPISDVIFDLDGTLVDSAPSILACFERTLASSGIKPALPLEPSLIGPPLRETLYRLSGVADEAKMAAMIEDFKRHYDEGGYQQTRIFPGIDALLRELKSAGFRLHIATNKRLRPTELILSHFDWRALFSAVYASDSRTPPFAGKQEMLGDLLRDKNIPAAMAFYIGDRHDDLTAAEANGLGFIAAAWGYRDEAMIAHNPPFFAEAAHDLRRLLLSAEGAAPF